MTIGPGLRHRVDLVRPAARSLRWLCAAVAELHADDRLAPVSVVVSSPQLGLVARRAWPRTAVQTCGPCCCARSHSSSRGPPFRGARSAQRRARSRGHQGRPCAARDASRGWPSNARCKTVSPRSSASCATSTTRARARGARIAGKGPCRCRRGLPSSVSLSAEYYDVPGLAALAAQAAERDAGRARGLGALVLYLPPRLDPAEIRMLGALGRWIPLVAAFVHLEEPQADRLLQAEAAALAATLGLGPPRCVAAAPEPGRAAVCERARRRGSARGGAPDRGEPGGGHPLWRMAAVYGQEVSTGRRCAKRWTPPSFPGRPPWGAGWFRAWRPARCSGSWRCASAASPATRSWIGWPLARQPPRKMIRFLPCR